MLDFGKFVKKRKKRIRIERRNMEMQLLLTATNDSLNQKDVLLSDHNQAQKREKKGDCRFSHHQQVLPQN
jgi:hypothetical protein